MTPEGRVYIEDGNHRLQAAAQSDREVAIRFRDGKGYSPQKNATEIGERLRSDLKGASEAPTGAGAGATPAASGVDVTIDHINDYLQTGKAAADGPLPHEIHASIEALDKAAQSTSLAKGRSAFMPLDEAVAEEMKRGANIVEPGYTMLNNKYTAYHGRAERPTTLLHLDIPKGARVGAEEGGDVLLPRGSRYRVTSISDGTVPANWSDGAGPDAPAMHQVRIVRAKLLPHGETPPLPELASAAAEHVAAPAAAEAGGDLRAARQAQVYAIAATPQQCRQRLQREHRPSLSLPPHGRSQPVHACESDGFIGPPPHGQAPR